MGPSEWDVVVMNSRHVGWDDWPYLAVVALAMYVAARLAKRLILKT
jgi:hypothetical protein